jgi:hypothetical protein
VHDDFADEVLRLSSRALKEFERFTSLLQKSENPYSPDIQERCVVHSHDLLEYPLKDGFFLLWKIHSQPMRHSELQFETEVFLLSIERR